VPGYLTPTIGSTSIESGATVSTVAGLTLTSPTLTSSDSGSLSGSGTASWSSSPVNTYPAGNPYGIKTVNSQKRIVMPNVANLESMPIGSTVTFGDIYSNNGVGGAPIFQTFTTTGLYDGNGFNIAENPTDTSTSDPGGNHEFIISWTGTESAKTITADTLRFLNPNAAGSVQHQLQISSKQLRNATITGTLTAGSAVGTNGQVLQSTGTGVQWATPTSSTPAATITSLGGFYGYPGGTTYSTLNSNVAIGGRAFGGDKATPSVPANTYQNVALGYGAMGNINAQWNGNNTAIGYQSGYNLGATGANEDNTFVGMQAGQGIYGTGSRNVAIGSSSQTTNNTNSDNTSVGYSALNANDGSNNIAIGSYAATFLANGGYDNVIIGKSSYNGAGGYFNVIIGNDAANSASGGSAETTAVGTQSLQRNTGQGNSGVGTYSLSKATTGNYNTAIGFRAGIGSTTDEMNNLSLTTGSNNTFIGNLSRPSSATVSNTITLGNSSIATIRAQVTSITSLSDARDKKNIESLSIGLDFVNSLNPVKFDWDYRQPEDPMLDADGNPIIEGKVDIPDIGFIAQDLVAVEDETGIADYLQLTYRDNPDRLEATQGRLIPILVKAIQELTLKVQELEGKI
jgi:hypothetical protein